MMSIRSVRGAGALKRGLGHGRPAGGCLRITEAPPVLHRSIVTKVTVARHDSFRASHIRQQEASKTIILSVLHSRCFSGYSKGSERKDGKAEGGAAKAPYSFLKQDDRARVSGESKDALETDKVAGKAEEEEEVSTWQRVKNARKRAKLLLKQYGLVAVGTYITLNILGIGGVYTVLATGLIEPNVDTLALIQQVADFVGYQDSPNVASFKYYVETNEWAERILMALVVNEFLELPRDLIVLVATPSIARALGRAPAKGTE